MEGTGAPRGDRAVMPKHGPDVDLVEAARAGDQDAWEQLCRGVYRRLRAYVARRVPGPHVDEVMRATVARAVAGIGGFTSGSGGFDGWVFGIARQVALEHSGPGPCTVQAGEAADDYAWLRGVFERLSPADQELLELRVVAALSADDVARVLGTRAGAVRVAQARALAHLRTLMEAGDRRSGR